MAGMADVDQADPEHPGRLAAPYYNFSSAAGIEYSIDVSRPPGDRVSIHGLSGGEAFLEDRIYSVAVNSYRGTGGGGHLTAGAGIPAGELAGRVRWSTERDLRYHLMEYLGQSDSLVPPQLDNWSVLPASLARPAMDADRHVLE